MVANSIIHIILIRKRNKMTELVTRAMQYAHKRHGDIDHVRKYTGEPYIVHPGQVAGMVASVPHTPEMLAAAWLHDVVEDTFDDRSEGLKKIAELFGTSVMLLVADLSDVSIPTDGNRKTRKALDREHTALAAPDAKTIKLADLISNTMSIATHDMDFAKVYLEEKALLLDVLTEGDSTLYKMAVELHRSTINSFLEE